jgi:hypothetical protein
MPVNGESDGMAVGSTALINNFLTLFAIKKVNTLIP